MNIKNKNQTKIRSTKNNDSIIQDIVDSLNNVIKHVEKNDSILNDFKYDVIKNINEIKKENESLKCDFTGFILQNKPKKPKKLSILEEMEKERKTK